MITPAVMGVDPGVRGGIAVLAADGQVAWLRALNPAMTRGDFRQAVRTAVNVLVKERGNLCYMEKVGTMPTDGRQGAFTFGRVVGLLEGAICAYDVEIRNVYPAIWQARLECLSGGNKNVTKTRAQALFPGVKMTHALADALLIARYGQLMEAL